MPVSAEQWRASVGRYDGRKLAYYRRQARGCSVSFSNQVGAVLMLMGVGAIPVFSVILTLMMRAVLVENHVRSRAGAGSDAIGKFGIKSRWAYTIHRFDKTLLLYIAHGQRYYKNLISEVGSEVVGSLAMHSILMNPTQ